MTISHKIIISTFSSNISFSKCRQIAALKDAGDSFELRVSDGSVLGLAVKTCQEATKPVFVSQGHRCSLETAKAVVIKCSVHRYFFLENKVVFPKNVVKKHLKI